MGVRYGKFELPNKIKVEKGSQTFARFVAEPFERGFGHTLGNMLRRILLSSLEAPSIISVLIEGVPHEFMAVDGIVEDVTNIILNLKLALLRHLPLETEVNARAPKMISKTFEITPDRLEADEGQTAVTLGELFEDSGFEVVNPELIIFHVTAPMTKKMSFRVSYGRGYVPSERQVLSDKSLGEIVIDAIYSPVRIVSYYIENTRVGQDTDYDRLVLDVQTDGRISPVEAMAFAQEIALHHLAFLNPLKAGGAVEGLKFDRGEVESGDDREVMLSKLATPIKDVELSVRAANCLQQADIATLADLVVRGRGEMLEYKNFGRKSLLEIENKLEAMGLSLNMDLQRYGITRDNVRTVIDSFQEMEHSASPHKNQQIEE